MAYTRDKDGLLYGAFGSLASGALASALAAALGFRDSDDMSGIGAISCGRPR